MFFTLDFWIQMLSAVVGTIGFAFLFRVRLCHFPYVALGALLTYFVYYTLEQLGWNLLLLTFLAACVGALYSEILARIRRAPAIVYLLSSMIPIIPGGSLYRAMNGLINKNYDSLFTNLGGTLNVSLGMAGGIVAVSVLMAIYVGLMEAIKNKRKAN